MAYIPQDTFQEAMETPRMEIATVPCDWKMHLSQLPEASAWHACLAEESAKKVLRGSDTIHILATCKSKKGGPKKYMSGGSWEQDGCTIYTYFRFLGDRAKKSGIEMLSERVLIRAVSCILAVTVNIREKNSGQTEVTATLLSGKEVFSQTYGDSEQCRAYQFRASVIAACIRDNICTKHVPVKMVDKEDHVIRGNRVLKPVYINKQKKNWMRKANRARTMSKPITRFMRKKPSMSSFTD